MGSKRYLLTLIFLCVFIGLTGCNTTLEPNIKDGGLLSGDPCGPPCFFEIHPGISTLEETKTALTKHGFIDSCKEGIYKIDSLICGNSTLQISFSKNYEYVTSVAFYVSPKIPIEDILSLYGEPEFIMMDEGATPEHQLSSIYIYYPTIDMYVITQYQESETFTLKPTTLIGLVIYSTNPMVRDDSKQSWNGYGTYTIEP